MILCPWGRADAGTLLAQADAAYAQRENVAQARAALAGYERNASLNSAQALESYWKASRTAWWVGQHEEKRAERLADFQRGADDARKALALDAQSVEAHFWLGGNLGSYGEAKGVLKSLAMVKPVRHEMEEVLRLNERFMNGAAYHVLGAVDYKVPGFAGGSKKRAREELEKALAMGPRDPFVHYYLAEFYRVSGDKAKSREEFATLQNLQVDPGNEPELRMLQQKALAWK